MRASFEIEPVGLKRGWVIAEDGHPRIWWKARIGSRHSIKLLSDGSNARTHEVAVSIYRGDATPQGQTLYKGTDPPSPMFGVITRSEHADIWVQLWVSEATVDRLMRLMAHSPPPVVTVGIGPNKFGAELQGDLTRDENRDGFKWDDTTKDSHIVVTAVQFTSVPVAIADDDPELPDKQPAFLRFSGVIWAVLMNGFAVLVAATVLNAAKTPFEEAVVCGLLMIYLMMLGSFRTMGPLLQKLENASISRFLHLRTLLGYPLSDAEEKYCSALSAKALKLTARYWIDSAGALIILLMLMFKLYVLVFS